MSKSLDLLFANTEGKTVRINVDEPKDSLTAEQIGQAMETIIQSNVFTSSGGSLVSKKGARIIEQTVTEYDELTEAPVSGSGTGRISDAIKGGIGLHDWLSFISDVGFPIVVTLYLLHRIEGKLDDLNHSIQMIPVYLTQKEN